MMGADKPGTPMLAEDNNRIMNEVLKNGRAVLTPSGTARFIDRREGLATRSYYHGLLPREDINKMLRDNGSFIVRTTSTVEVGFNPQKCLSVRWNEKVRHFLLDKSPDGVYSVDKYKTKFKSVEDLVDHYHKTGELFSIHHCRLITPIGRAKWEFRHCQIELYEKLGEGMFGEVYSGFLSTKRNRISVAIKTLKCAHITKDKIDESMKEARLLRRCHHRNIVRFYGVAAEEEPLMIIMEMVRGGSLDTYLEQKGLEISVEERLRMCCQAAFAIRYLHRRNILHRDIAARNCLYDREKCLKLSDFGLSVHAKKYKMQRSERIPLRWMSPEVFRTQLYTQHADIWALGVLIWEVFNNAAEPYANWTGAQIKHELLENNYRLTLPNAAPEDLKKMLTKIFTLDTEARLTADEVTSELAKITPNISDPSDTTTTADHYKFLKENDGQSFGGSMESMLHQNRTDPELHLSESIEESSYAPPSEYNNFIGGEKSPVPGKQQRGDFKKAAQPESVNEQKKRNAGHKKGKTKHIVKTQDIGKAKKSADPLEEKQKPKRKENKSAASSLRSERLKGKMSNKTKPPKKENKTTSPLEKESKKTKKAKNYENQGAPTLMSHDEKNLEAVIQELKTPSPRPPNGELEQTQEYESDEPDNDHTPGATTSTDSSGP